MKTKLELEPILIIILLAIVLGVIIRLMLPRNQVTNANEPTTTNVVHDTITKDRPILVHDTIRETQVVRVEVKEYIPLNPKFEDEQFREATKMMSDSVDVLLPITQKEYSDSDYTAWVSGYNPSLDSIRLYSRTITHTIVKQPKWGLSVGVGASIGRRIEPCVFLGVTYTFKTF